jgi:polyphosphate glucokinase
MASAVGVDVGGSGIKAALVDLRSGEFASGRRRVPTPPSLDPVEVMAAVAGIVDGFDAPALPVGVGFPAVVRAGVVRTPFTAYQDSRWVGCSVAAELSERLGRRVTVLNDADAAGLAEMRWGSGRGERGVVLVLTLGTGIGSALFTGGVLVPNTELGHLYLRGRKRVAEWRAAASARKRARLSWKRYAARLEEYLIHVERLLSPDLVIVGGGVSKSPERFLPRLSLSTPVVAATLGNRAGIIGAGLAAEQAQGRHTPQGR